MLRRNLTMQLALPALLVALAAIALLVAYAGHASRDRVVAQLVRGGVAQLDGYRELRSYYTEAVVAPARASGLEVSPDHALDAGTIPLPVTMFQELSARLEDRENGLRMDLYSDHPFPSRKARVLDDFARSALARFEADPEGIFYEVSEIAGERFVRVAMADRMNSEACVSCHNGHPDSPRRGWKLGDVRGVLEVDLSAEQALAAAEDLESTLLVGGAAASVALLLVVGLVTRRIGRRLEETVEILDRVAHGDLDVTIGTPEPDELGAIKSALDTAIGHMRADMESLHRSRVLIDAAPVNILYCDPDHVVSYANAACDAAITGIAEAAGVDGGVLVGQSVAFLFGGDEAMREVLESDQWLPYRGTRSLGGEMLDVSVDAIEGLDGQRVGSLVTFSVVTEEQHNAVLLREAMEAERDSADRLRAAIERERESAEAEGEVAERLRRKADLISSVMEGAASGDLTQRVGLDGDEPMDRIAEGLDRFLDDLSARILQIREISANLAATGHQLDDVGKNIVGGARQTSDEVGAVARAWTATSEGVDGIGTRVQGLATSYEGIAESSSAATEVVQAGVEAANEARSAIEELDRSTQEIQIILTVIDQIADQSKLLALNASIEAARAGESGRGFNVVAQEVKKLATQTEEATGEIAGTIEKILARGDRSVASIRSMGDVMDRVEANQALIAETMTEQQSATQEVRELAQQVRDRSTVIASSIESLSLVAESNEENAAGTDREANKLMELATQINELTSRFAC